MLLHPNQFSIGNPASPGGPQQPRKTRRTGHKFGDTEDLAAATENKRKRKLFEEMDNGSPGPTGRNQDLGMGSPFREAKARTMHTQFEASAYSLERLFTEKELNMTINQATTAASHFFATMKNSETTQPQEPATNGNGTNGITTHDAASESGDPADRDMDLDSDSPTGALDMTRTISSNPHATRGQTRSTLNPSNIAAGHLPFIYNPPFVLDSKIFSKLNASAPAPTPLTQQDVEQDLKLMLRDARPDDELNEKLLMAAVNNVKAREYQIQVPGYREPVQEMTGMVRSFMPHLEVGLGGLGGVPMSAQSSMGGYSDAGGNTPMGRLGESSLGGAMASALGGVGMARTASGSGRRGGRRVI
jgi:hypothetical protein